MIERCVSDVSRDEKRLKGTLDDEIKFSCLEALVVVWCRLAWRSCRVVGVGVGRREGGGVVLRLGLGLGGWIGDNVNKVREQTCTCQALSSSRLQKTQKNGETFNKPNK